MSDNPILDIGLRLMSISLPANVAAIKKFNRVAFQLAVKDQYLCAASCKISVMKKRVMCVFGTRPEAVKLAPVVHALRRSAALDTIVVSTAQHREMLDQMLRWFEIEP